MLPGMWESVREKTSTLPNDLLVWELEFSWILKSLKSNFKRSKPIGLKSSLYH